MKPHPYALDELAGPLVEALERLMRAQAERKPYLVVTEVVTDNFVQFCASAKEKLLFDVPEQDAIGGEGIDMYKVADVYDMTVEDLHIHAPTEADPDAEELHRTLQRGMRDAREGAAFAIRFLREVLYFGEIADARFVIEEGGEPMN